MSPEEFQRLKEAEKEHLRKLRELKSAVRTHERQQKLTRAIEQITGADADVEGTREEMMERMTNETARYEAHLDLALESAAEQEEAARRAAEAEAFEEASRKRRADDLIRQMKEEMGPAAATRTQPAPQPPRAQEHPRDPKSETSESPTRPPGTRPEKTIGRM